MLQTGGSPSETVVLQWATYYDAADEAGASRRYGGIHPYFDDYPGRVSAEEIGSKAFLKALEYFGPARAMMCHFDPQSGTTRTIRVRADRVRGHLDRGDSLGPCYGAGESQYESSVGESPRRIKPRERRYDRDGRETRSR